MDKTTWIPFKEVVIGNSLRLCVDKEKMLQQNLNPKFVQILFNPESILPSSILNAAVNRDIHSFQAAIEPLQLNLRQNMQLYVSSILALNAAHESKLVDKSMVISQMHAVVAARNAIIKDKRDQILQRSTTICPEVLSDEPFQFPTNYESRLPWPITSQAHFFDESSIDNYFHSLEHDNSCTDPTKCLCGIVCMNDFST